MIRSAIKRSPKGSAAMCVHVLNHRVWGMSVVSSGSRSYRRAMRSRLDLVYPAERTSRLHFFMHSRSAILKYIFLDGLSLVHCMNQVLQSKAWTGLDSHNHGYPEIAKNGIDSASETSISDGDGRWFCSDTLWYGTGPQAVPGASGMWSHEHDHSQVKLLCVQIARS